jgi:hypothetical protein
MQEPSAVQADIDESGLHARHHPLHPAFIDIANHAPARRAFDLQLLQHAVFDQGDAGFARSDVDQDFFGHDSLQTKSENRRSSDAVSNKGKPITPE